MANGVILGRQTKVYEFIVEHKKIHDGNSPSIREIADGCHISSTSVVKYNLDQLVEAGLIRQTVAGNSRDIEVVGGKWSMKPARMEYSDEPA